MVIRLCVDRVGMAAGVVLGAVDGALFMAVLLSPVGGGVGFHWWYYVPIYGVRAVACGLWFGYELGDVDDWRTLGVAGLGWTVGVLAPVLGFWLLGETAWQIYALVVVFGGLLGVAFALLGYAMVEMARIVGWY